MPKKATQNKKITLVLIVLILVISALITFYFVRKSRQENLYKESSQNCGLSVDVDAEQCGYNDYPDAVPYH